MCVCVCVLVGWATLDPAVLAAPVALQARGGGAYAAAVVAEHVDGSYEAM